MSEPMGTTDSASGTIARDRPAPSLLRSRRQKGFWTHAARRFLRNRLANLGLAIVSMLAVMALFAPLITAHHYAEPSFGKAWRFPSGEFWMGTDGIGRDFFARVVYGARVSLSVGLIAQLISFLIGVPLGILAGLQGGRTDYFIMRAVEGCQSFPRMLVAILLMTLLGSGLGNVLLAIGITSWIPICRLARAEVLSHRERDYVLAAQALGADTVHLLVRHLLPNVLPVLLVAISLGIPEAIFTEAGLSFLGVGINPPTPSWGQMVGESVNYIRHFWHLALFPAVMIAWTMLGFTLLGDGLRDALDLKMQVD
jgi:ABC-type dipeptide/oligopeptide/nickel transport system permease subunit